MGVMHFFVCVLLLAIFCQNSFAVRYEPNWKSLDSRPLPAWYDEGKVGIFLHWGVFSVPAYGSEWFWWHWKGQKLPAYVLYMMENYRPDFTYADFAPSFHAEFYNPAQWADTIKKSGANYVVLVTKHHEGFTNWPSEYSWNWNAGDVGPKRDLVGDLADAIRSNTKVKFGVYHSMFEWFNPLFEQDKANGFRTQDYVRDKTMPELYELVKRYKPEIVWSDGEWMAADTYWNSTDFIAWLYNDRQVPIASDAIVFKFNCRCVTFDFDRLLWTDVYPIPLCPVKDTVVVNDRWGNNTRCKHGGFWDCRDHYTPGKLVHHKWENCMPVDKYSWGFRANAKLSDIHTIEELIEQMVTTVSCGGNILFNVGPTAYGEIAPIYEERLLQIGSWLDVNGEAIYKTHVWSHQNDSVAKDVWYTTKDDKTIYAILLSWPQNGELDLAYPALTDLTTVSMIGYSGSVMFKTRPKGGITVTMPQIPQAKMPCKWAWVLRLKGLKNQKTHIDWNSLSKKVESIRMEKDFY